MRWSMSCEYIFSSPMMETTEAVVKGNLKTGVWVGGRTNIKPVRTRPSFNQNPHQYGDARFKRPRATGRLCRLQGARKKRLRWASQGWLLWALAETLKVLTTSGGPSGKGMVCFGSPCRPCQELGSVAHADKAERLLAKPRQNPPSCVF